MLEVGSNIRMRAASILLALMLAGCAGRPVPVADEPSAPAVAAKPAPEADADESIWDEVAGALIDLAVAGADACMMFCR